MAKNKTLPTLEDRLAALRLGDSVQVKALPGTVLRNNETGGFFEADLATPQTVTTTLLRRLADGDLVLVDA